ncbi:MarR family transcriptional regulator [Comamonas sp. MYb21]|uniref:MarR family winged helix-turn-helix transcriptional regulator n=1 Tax=Comamonas sp. MYb21 TaxID=1848648 RepID=UPI0030A6422C
MSGVKLDRALFPLLSRVSICKNTNVAELANLVGRDHSTVSRQIVKLEKLGLLVRVSDPKDQRSRHLILSTEGQKMMEKIHLVRRRWMEAHFAQWDSADRDKLIDLMDRMLVRDDERDN